MLEKKYEEEGHYQCLLEGMKIYEQLSKDDQMPTHEKITALQKDCDRELQDRHQIIQLERSRSRGLELSK